MTHEEIIKTWFAIDELGGENVHTKLQSYQDPLCRAKKKMYCAYIHFGLEHTFFAHETDVYLAMEGAINKYSEWVIRNSK